MNTGRKGGRKATQTHTHLSFYKSYLDSFYPKSQGGCWAYGLPPLHVSGLGHHFLQVFLWRRRLRINLYHFLIHVRPRRGLFPSLGQLFLEVGPEVWGEKSRRWVGEENRNDERMSDRCQHIEVEGWGREGEREGVKMTSVYLKCC